MDKKQFSMLLSKLRQPIHIDYISKYIVKESIDETRKVLDKLITEGVVEESENSKDYYVIKNV